MSEYTFPRVSVDYNEDTVIYSIIEDLRKQLLEQIEAGYTRVLRRAYIAGAEMAYCDTCGCISDPRDRYFDDWLEDLKESLRSGRLVERHG